MKIALLGDIALVGQFDGLTDGSSISYLIKILQGYDYIIANLESPLTNKKHTLVPKSMHLRADEKSVAILKKLGINAVTLANNHTYDYGRKGLEDTIRVLETAGIKWYGIDGKSLSETIRNEKVSFSGYCCLSTNGTGYRKASGKGINILTRDNLEEQLEQDKLAGAVSIISAHYGIEHTNYPAIEHISLFDHISDKNVVVVHGHHPHQVQGVIEKNGSIIAYSLGNAIFDKTTSINGAFTVEMNEENRKSFVLGICIENGKITGYETKGFYISDRGIINYDIENELGSFSAPLEKITDKEAYQKERQKQYQSVLNIKFGKHDVKWLISRLNYYSIGAKIGSMKRAKIYQKIKSEF